MSGRIRTIKPEILEDERVAALSDRGFRAFIASIVMADDHGNLRADPRYVRGAIYWAHDGVTAGDAAEGLAEVARAGLHEPYAVNGQTYVHISGWAKHQRVDNAGKPRVPRPEDTNGLAEVRGEIPRTAETRGDSRKEIPEVPEKQAFGEPPRNSANLGESPKSSASRARADLRPPTPTPTPTPNAGGGDPDDEIPEGAVDVCWLRALRQAKAPGFVVPARGLPPGLRQALEEDWAASRPKTPWRAHCAQMAADATEWVRETMREGRARYTSGWSWTAFATWRAERGAVLEEPEETKLPVLEFKDDPRDMRIPANVLPLLSGIGGAR